jgi:hypothetical protein
LRGRMQMIYVNKFGVLRIVDELGELEDSSSEIREETMEMTDYRNKV